MSNTRPEFSWAISGLSKTSKMHFSFNSELWLICCFAEIDPEIQSASYACTLFISFSYTKAPSPFLFFPTYKMLLVVYYNLHIVLLPH